MENMPALFADHIHNWPDPAQHAFHACRSLFHASAKALDVNPLDETLKWGQAAWRPKKPRTGVTLRLHWRADDPGKLGVFMDCKTDLAARMQTLYPDLPVNDGRRHVAIDLTAPLPEAALSHLAEMAFSYHLSPKQRTQTG